MRPLYAVPVSLVLALLAIEPRPTPAESKSPPAAAKKVTRYARYKAGDTVAYGIVVDGVAHEIAGDLFAGKRTPTGRKTPLSKVQLLAPCQPTQVFALAGNYRSHLPGESIPEKFKIPQLFIKLPTCIVGPGEAIVLPKEAGVVHYEGELVVVIGKRCRNVSRAQAHEYVFGVTCGNDVSARVWQKGDVQWWRAKGSATFGPLGPFLVTGLNYDDLLLQLRQNGKVRQKQRTKDLIHDVAGTVSFISRHAELLPGDVIYTGTPGKTDAMKAGDVVEVEIEGIGTLRNPVVAEK